MRGKDLAKAGLLWRRGAGNVPPVPDFHWRTEYNLVALHEDASQADV